MKSKRIIARYGKIIIGSDTCIFLISKNKYLH